MAPGGCGCSLKAEADDEPSRRMSHQKLRCAALLKQRRRFIACKVVTSFSSSVTGRRRTSALQIQHLAADHAAQTGGAGEQTTTATRTWTADAGTRQKAAARCFFARATLLGLRD
jgi:hypothetical protein